MQIAQCIGDLKYAIIVVPVAYILLLPPLACALYFTDMHYNDAIMASQIPSLTIDKKSIQCVCLC